MVKGQSCLWWWWHGMERLSTLLALCEGNPPVTGGFPSQRASNADLWGFLCCYSTGLLWSRPALMALHGNTSLITGPLWRESTSHWLFPSQRASNARGIHQWLVDSPHKGSVRHFFKFVCCYSRHTVEQTVQITARCHNQYSYLMITGSLQICATQMVLNFIVWWRHQMETFSA